MEGTEVKRKDEKDVEGLEETQPVRSGPEAKGFVTARRQVDG
jgi:hypothetical protein